MGLKILTKGPGEAPVRSGHGLGPDIRLSASGSSEREAVQNLGAEALRQKGARGVVGKVREWLVADDTTALQQSLPRRKSRGSHRPTVTH